MVLQNNLFLHTQILYVLRKIENGKIMWKRMIKLIATKIWVRSAQYNYYKAIYNDFFPYIFILEYVDQWPPCLWPFFPIFLLPTATTATLSFVSFLPPLSLFFLSTVITQPLSFADHPHHRSQTEPLPSPQTFTTEMKSLQPWIWVELDQGIVVM